MPVAIFFFSSNLVRIRCGCWRGPSAAGKPSAGVSVALCQRSSALADMRSLLVTVITEGAVGKWLEDASHLKYLNGD